MRRDIVRVLTHANQIATLITLQRHTFKAPAKPIEPPTPRGSLLGLDRLAKEKRDAAALENGDSSRKRPRLDDSEPRFKGMY